MRLNAYLARAGVASRRKADELIVAGRVQVNGRPGELHTTVDAGDRVELDGSPLHAQGLRTVLLYKPRGVVTTASDPEGRPTVVDLVGGDTRVVPVGRLDSGTTGALLLTNDGELAFRLSHPRYGVEKRYLVNVDPEPSADQLDALARGVELEDGLTAPARVSLVGPTRIELVLHEGRNRQVRRMCEAVGLRVRQLHRPQVAHLTLRGLRRGDHRDLTGEELAALRRLVGLQAPASRPAGLSPGKKARPKPGAKPPQGRRPR